MLLYLPKYRVGSGFLQVHPVHFVVPVRQMLGELCIQPVSYTHLETLLVLAIGMCLGMVMLSSYAGFSPALGAFVMGSILAETTQAERIEHIVQPVKDLFGAVFFVSVGMLIDPKVLIDYSGPILIITLTLIVGKVLHVIAGALIAGQPLKRAIHAGMSMGQIGEFSFIIATLGVTLGVTSSFLYPCLLYTSRCV